MSPKDTAEAVKYSELVVELLNDGVCPVDVIVNVQQPWREYCGNPLNPGTNTCHEHQHHDQ